MGLAAVVAAGALAFPALAAAHVERSTYWPDPEPDKKVKPAAGGVVPRFESLGSALKAKPRGQTRVVCRGNSLNRARQSIRAARKNGFKLRPSEEKQKLSAPRARKLRRLNRRFDRECEYRSIQKAIFDSGNNDRVVVMPGVYKESKSRAAATDDPACEGLTGPSDHGTGAVSYRYQAECPNDQNLIAILGRTASKEPEPAVDPDTDRHGIPHPGKCIRCNLQIEGSGPKPEDVMIDAGAGPKAGTAAADKGKDVGIRIDRADGAAIRNLTVRHAAEHGIYPIEVDGYVLDRVKMLFNHEYGHLSFTSDHGLVKNCEVTGSGDAAIYPGSAAQTGEQTIEPAQRVNQEFRRCDLHHNALGHSGSMGDGILLTKNDFYDNAVGISVDSISAAGHPGYPQDSAKVVDNEIYSNNFNPYEEDSDVVPTVPAAVGTGMWIAGGNADVLRDNHIYDNWRRGVMLFAVPDALACAPGEAQQTCDETGFSNSHRNRFQDNVMGIAPDGTVQPNGLDFWWDEFSGNTANCWFDNTGADGTPESITSEPSPLPDCDGGENPDSSVGTGNAEHEEELTACFVAFEGDGPEESCPWFETPPKPESSAAGRAGERQR